MLNKSNQWRCPSDLYRKRIAFGFERAIKTTFAGLFSKYKPQTVKVTDDKEQMIAYKKYSALGFISGEMSELKRTNKNLIRRDALILDLDDIGDITENDLKQKIHNIFYEVDYVLYPSVSNGVKGVRYRLVLPITEPVEEQDYKLLIRFVTHKILADIIKKPDASNETWSQLMLLPIVTQYNPRESLITVLKGNSDSQQQTVWQVLRRGRETIKLRFGGINNVQTITWVVALLI